MNLQKTLFLQCFLALTPQIWGVKSSPPNLGGMGSQGNRTIVIAESLARLIVAIRITSVPWRSYISPSPKSTEIGPHRSCVRCVAIQISGTGRIRFRGVRFQTPNSVSFFGLAEFRGANSVSSSQPIICVPKRTHRVFSQNSPSLPQNSVSSLFRNSTLREEKGTQTQTFWSVYFPVG